MQKEIIANTSDAVTETEGLPKPTKSGGQMDVPQEEPPCSCLWEIGGEEQFR